MSLHPKTLAALEAGPHKTHLIGEMHRVEETYAQFARRIALIEQEAEREECAKIADDMDYGMGEIPAAIRRRGKP